MNIAKCDKSFNAELRKGGPLVGRASRRVSQFCLIYGLTAVLCGST
jgi:hypothetical protein